MSYIEIKLSHEIKESKELSEDNKTLKDHIGAVKDSGPQSPSEMDSEVDYLVADGFVLVPSRKTRHTSVGKPENGLKNSTRSTIKDKSLVKGRTRSAISHNGTQVTFSSERHDARGFSFNVVINENLIKAKTAYELFDILDSDDWERFHDVNLLTFFYRLTRINKELTEGHAVATEDKLEEIEEELNYIYERLHDKKYWGEISAVIIEWLPTFDPRSLCNFSHALVVFEIQDKTLLDQIANAALTKIKKFNAHDMAEITWTLATLEYSHPPLCNKIARKILDSKFDGFNIIDYSQTFWAYSKLQVLEYPLLENFLDVFSKKLKAHIADFDIGGLISIALALANFKHVNKPLFEAIAVRVLELINDCSAHELSVMAWSMAHSKNFHSTLLQKIIALSIAKMSTFSGHNLSMLAWSMAQLKKTFPALNLSFEPLFKAIGERSLQLKLADFPPRQLSNLAWSYATLNIPHEMLFKAIADRVIILFEDKYYVDEECVNQSLSNIAWAFATAKVPNENLFRAIATKAKTQFKTFIPIQFAMLTWALAKNRQSFPNNLTSYEKSLLELMATWVGNIGLQNFSNQNTSNFFWGLARFDIYNEALIQKIIASILSEKSMHLDPRSHARGRTQSSPVLPQHISNLMWSLATLKADHNEALVALIDMALAQKLSNFQLINLTEMLWASATLRFTHRPFLRAATAKILEAPLSAFDIVCLANIAWSCAVLEFVDDKLYNLLRDLIEAKKGDMRIAECDQIYHFWQFTEMKKIPLFNAELKALLKEMMTSVPIPESSGSHLQVASIVEKWAKSRPEYNYSLENERPLLGYYADIFMKEKQGKQTFTTYDFEIMGEEFHYTRFQNKLIGHNHLKKMLLEAKGILWIEIPLRKWEQQSNHLKYLDDLISKAKMKKSASRQTMLPAFSTKAWKSISDPPAAVTPAPAQSSTSANTFKLNASAKEFTLNFDHTSAKPSAAPHDQKRTFSFNPKAQEYVPTNTTPQQFPAQSESFKKDLSFKSDSAAVGNRL